MPSQNNSDPIRPAYYHAGDIDVIKFAEANFPKEELRGFYRINILKYVTRYDKKNGIEDLEKAEFYRNKLRELEGVSNESIKVVSNPTATG